MSKEFVVAVCGATGAVGQEMLKVLEQRDFPYSKLIPMASSRSAGKKVMCKGEEHTVIEMKEDSFDGVDIALFSAGGSTSEKFAPLAAKAGCVVVDNSSAWRMNEECPLVVPEVNPHDLDWHNGIIANPNCSTIQMMVALKPIHDEAKIKRVVVSTYQAVSGTGQKAIEELENQVRRLMSGQPVVADVYPHQIAFNCLPHIDVFMDNGYTKEEMKMVNETVKIMGDATIKVTATCVRVPVFYGHSESVNIETEEKMTADDVRALLARSPGIEIEDYPEKKAYPMPVDAAGQDATYVGRIREDETIDNGINMWIVSDNIRKGAALNTVQIAETLIERDLVRVPRSLYVVKVVDSKEYLDAMLAIDRPGAEEIHAFYEHRVGMICKDPKTMLMPWDDHLVHRGDGIFEAMKFVDGKLYQLDPHLDRMKRSASSIYLEPPCSWEEIRELILDVCRAGGRDSGMLRVFLGRGPGGFGVYPSECPETSLYIVAADLHPPKASFYEKGATAFKTSIPAKQSYLATIKSIDYLPNVLMKREAQEKGYDFPFCFDDADFLAEGATENVCVVSQDGKLIIPEFTNALAGTTLLRAVDLIKHDMSIIFRGITKEEIMESREVIIVGTTGDAIPVVRFNGKPIHDVKPGPVAKRIRELLRQDLQENGVPL